MNKEKEFNLTSLEKKACIELARKSINYFFHDESQLKLNETEISLLPKKLLEKKACFITLTIKESGEASGATRHTSRDQAKQSFADPEKQKLFSEPGWRLRGCIGHLSAIQPLYKDIIENSLSAAFSDPRFPGITQSEFKNIKIEVSILTDPFDFEFKTSKELLNSLVVGKDGLIIKKGYHSATFLPSVWDEIKSKEEFLSHLCQKAGLLPNEWTKQGIKVQKYYAIKAKE
ncbi:MAG: AmmeMemoRadiSam system protein A [archaeon]|jgi:AmmeMemoRadiSam system protein A